MGTGFTPVFIAVIVVSQLVFVALFVIAIKRAKSGVKNGEGGFLSSMVRGLQKLIKTPTPVNPATFADPIADQTEWIPAKRGGTNICTHRLIEVDRNRMEFRSTRSAKLLYGLFLIIGLIVISVGFVAAVAEGKLGANPDTIIPIVVGTVFSLIGGALLFFLTAPIVFDRRKGYYWKGRKNPDEVFNKKDLKNFAELDRVYAIQLLSEFVRSDKSSFYSYELNMVFKDGARMNVIDHGKMNEIRKDAALLAEFLEVPMWDAIHET